MTQSAVQITFVGERRITVANSATETDTETDNNFSELREVPVN